MWVGGHGSEEKWEDCLRLWQNQPWACAVHVAWCAVQISC